MDWDAMPSNVLGMYSEGCGKLGMTLYLIMFSGDALYTRSTYARWRRTNKNNTSTFAVPFPVNAILIKTWSFAFQR